MKLLVIGNSHTAAIQNAVTEGRTPPGVTLEVAALGGFLHRLFYVDGTVLRLADPPDGSAKGLVKRYVSEMFGAFAGIDLTGYDGVVHYNADVPVNDFIVWPLMRELAGQARYGERYVMDALAGLVDELAPFQLAAAIARAVQVPVFYATPPFITAEGFTFAMSDRSDYRAIVPPGEPVRAARLGPVRALAHAATVRFTRRHRTVSPQNFDTDPRRLDAAALTARRSAIMAYVAERAGDAGARHLVQPEETVEHVAFTAQRFSEGSLGLKGDAHPVGEARHMNALFGERWIAKLAAEMRAPLAASEGLGAPVVPNPSGVRKIPV